MSDFANFFLKIGCLLIVIGLILVIVHTKYPNQIKDDFYLAIIGLGLIPIFCNAIDAMLEFFCWIWRLFK